MLEEFDSKQRKIRSFRGFFLYGLEIIENAEDYEILERNLQSFFWKKVKNIIRQNKKGAFLEFLFGCNSGRVRSYQGLKNIGFSPTLDAKIQNQVNSLQQKVIHL